MLEMHMVAAHFPRIETPPCADAPPDAKFLRGLLYSLLFSVPIWIAIVTVARTAF